MSKLKKLTTFTPGEWEQVSGEDSGIAVFAWGDDGEEHMLPVLMNPDGNSDLLCPNPLDMKLILAAPKLFRALQAITAFLAQLPGKAFEDDDQYYTSGLLVLDARELLEETSR
jgi:hypothetical protein